jgi:hypothetical protein
MLSQGLGNGLRRSILRSSGVGASLATLLLLGSSAAIAAPTFVPSAQTLQIAQSTTTPTNSGDVIVDTEPQRPGATTSPSSGSTTTSCWHTLYL